MIDIKFLKSHPEVVKEAVKNRNMNMGKEIDELLEVEKGYIDNLQKVEKLKFEQGLASKKIPKLKKNGENCDELMTNLKHISDEIAEKAVLLNEFEGKRRQLLMAIPNIPHESVAVGKDDSENVEIRKFKEPRKFDFEPKPHWKIGKNLGILDPESAAKVSGSRFHFYKGLGAKLERSLVNFFLETHTKSGYIEVFPPAIISRASMEGTGQLPKFEEDAFKVSGLESFLAPTAEVPVTNMHRGEIILEEDLPIKYCAYSPCFRAEAGSAGRDTRGLIRQHQFNKVELVEFCKPKNSYTELENLTHDAEKILQLLELPYRVVLLCTGDLGFCSAKTYDIEVWMPSYNRYVEISSCSNFEEYQARRMSIRYKKDAKSKPRLVHTLNGSGLAVGRTVAAILENYQNVDGSITVPKVLLDFMKTEVISGLE